MEYYLLSDYAQYRYKANMNEAKIILSWERNQKLTKKIGSVHGETQGTHATYPKMPSHSPLGVGWHTYSLIKPTRNSSMLIEHARSDNIGFIIQICHTYQTIKSLHGTR